MNQSTQRSVAISTAAALGQDRCRQMTPLIQIGIAGHDIAVQAARNFRMLRARGIAVRKTIDTLIATRCIEDDLSLLYSDRHFDPFVEHLGLASAMNAA